MRNAMMVSLIFVMASACSSMHSNDMAGSSMAMGNKTIAEVAMSTGMHNTLVAALKAAGLADMLMQSGNYTVLAPTDAAFAKLPAGTVDMLLLPENREKLRALLQYHVIPGRVDAAHIMNMTSLRTVSGQTLNVMKMSGGVMVGNATVIKADVPASNGIVHVIDTVLMPPGM